MLDKEYTNTLVQKDGVPGVPGCLERTSVIFKITEDAKRNHGDLTLLWLNLISREVTSGCSTGKRHPTGAHQGMHGQPHYHSSPIGQGWISNLQNPEAWY